MLIDWFTVGAQAVNFLILVWLLRRFLYQPILRAIDAREERVAAELADATAKQADAEKARAEFEAKNEALDQAKAGVLAQATSEAQAERERLLEEARQTANAVGARRQKALEEEAKSLRTTLEESTRKEVFEVVRKTLTDLASTSLEDRMVETFLARLKTADDKTLQSLQQLGAADPASALIRSAFELSPDQRQR
ncbi:MAG TPA: F0F1 ATP synthase subunit B, partial [Planctomycetota bacterium]|nr:F0F1 ATP synthase subunit B [Planctomycetota bacterium]